MTYTGPSVSDRYRVVRELGHGGMATVYLAVDTRYDREVAIKVLDPDIAQGVAAERFLREIDVAAKITHPHIVPLLDSGATDGRLWFVMPVLDGQSLRERLAHDKQLPVGESVRLIREVASALTFAHSRGVVHRDIKPENILLSGGTAALADFGLAKGMAAAGTDTLTRTGFIVGTAVYMSPEQSSGETVDARSDIYSLGCVLYEMLAGEPPYIGSSAQAVIAKRFSDPVPSARRLRSSISPALDDVIKRALATSPADRFQTAEEFAAALTRVAGSDAAAPAHSGAIEFLQARRWRSTTVAIVAAAALVVGAVALWRREAATPASHAPRSIAVLPFANLSDDKSQEYFSAGMTDELLSALSLIKQLRVAGRASSYAIHDKTTDLGEIGRKLNVEAVLDGTVRKDGDRVRISAELVSVSDGFRIWSATYDRQLTDVFTMQEEIARAIVGAIQLDLGGRSVVRKPTEDMAAYELYLRGRHALDLRTAAAIRDGADYFRKATDRDPSYAKAWAGLADAYILEALNFYAYPADAYPRAKAAATRAATLDSTLADAYTSLGTVLYLYDRDFAGAARAYDRAIQLDPKYPAAHYFDSIFLTGRDDARAEREAETAQQLDPLSPPMAQALGMLLVNVGRYQDAIAPLRAAIAIEPNYYFPHAWLSHALEHTGQASEAVAEAQRAVQLNPNNALVLAYLGEVYATTGDRAKALRVVAQIDSISKSRPVCGVYVARIYDRLGDADHAFAWLDRAAASHEGQLPQIVWPDAFTTIRSDPRFGALVRKLGLSP